MTKCFPPSNHTAKSRYPPRATYHASTAPTYTSTVRRPSPNSSPKMNAQKPASVASLGQRTPPPHPLARKPNQYT